LNEGKCVGLGKGLQGRKGRKKIREASGKAWTNKEKRKLKRGEETGSSENAVGGRRQMPVGIQKVKDTTQAPQ